MDKLHMKLMFEEARLLYPGTKRGLEVEWEYFWNLKKFAHRRSEIVSLMVPAIKRQIVRHQDTTDFVPSWKNFKSWVYNEYWTLEWGSKDKNAPVACKNCGEPSTGMYGNTPHCRKLECKAAAGDGCAKYLIEQGQK